MATVSDITTTPTSGLNHIDALLDTGPDWNYLTPAGNTLYYTFSILSGNESGQGGQEAFTLAQQAATRTALDYISTLTGIQFTETVNGADAQIHLCNVDLQGSNVTGLCSWHSSYSYSGTQLASYEADAYVYLDNVEWFSQNRNLTPGGYGYETLLHELGHALGLKHPFDDSIHLPASQDNTNYTLMSYTNVGGAHAAYSQYDIAALNWLYGGDGLGGALGINSTTGARYITGTSGADTLTGSAANDKLEGDGGNDMIDGGNGFDTAVFRGVRSSYAFSALANGDLTVTSTDGTDGFDTLHSIELLQFADMSVTRADITTDTTAPGQPTLVVTKNVNGYATGNTPLVTGKAEAGSTVKVFTAGSISTGGNQLVGSVTADANGLYTLKLNTFSNGSNYEVYATATDASGNVSAASNVVGFKVDATPPSVPTYNMSYSTGSNQATFSGAGEAGSTIELVRSGDLQTIARTTVGSDGKWQLETSPLPNANYTVSVISLDQADNGTSAASRATLTVSSSANITGTAANDTLKPGAGNNAVDGGAGLDTAVYTGARSNFTLGQEAWGFGVTDKAGANGHDSLINVERVQFDDAWVALDIDGTAGQLFRLYSAAFGRPSDVVGMGFWIWRMETGSSLNTVAREFMTGQPEFDTMYGVAPTDQTFITKLYNNVLGRDPDSEGFQYWLNTLGNNSNPNKTEVRAQVLIDFADSLENQVNVVGSFKLGIDYVPWSHT
jgi:serralysin